MKRWVFRIVGIGALCAAVGFLLSATGLVPIKASSGHWPTTRWFLEFSKRRSIATYSRGVEAPALDAPGLILKGAGHYAIACAPCHGSPEIHQPRIARHMTPHPPSLNEATGRWKSEELFTIIKHGLKFTGMPAWPAQQRDDEVWALVAFVRQLPGLDTAAYRRMAYGEREGGKGTAPIEDLSGQLREPQRVTQSCVRCHGADGAGRGQTAFPKLAGQRVAYLQSALAAYARGDRHSGIMEPIAYGLSADEKRELAEYYAALSPVTASSPKAQSATAAGGAIARGESIARRGIPSQRVPSCMDCHGPEGKRRRATYPSLAGQPADYLALQLELFKSGKRGGSVFAHLMHRVAGGLTTEQMRDVALYYESLDARP